MAKVLHSYARRSMDIAGFTVDDHCIADDTGCYLGLPLVPFSRCGYAVSRRRRTT